MSAGSKNVYCAQKARVGPDHHLKITKNVPITEIVSYSGEYINRTPKLHSSCSFVRWFYTAVGYVPVCETAAERRSCSWPLAGFLP